MHKKQEAADLLLRRLVFDGKNFRRKSTGTGGTDTQGYIRWEQYVRGKKIHIMEHQLSWYYHYGEWPYPEDFDGAMRTDTLRIDHKNDDRANNAADNLQLTDAYGNAVRNHKERFPYVAPPKWHSI